MSESTDHLPILRLHTRISNTKCFPNIAHSAAMLLSDHNDQKLSKRFKFFFRRSLISRFTLKYSLGRKIQLSTGDIPHSMPLPNFFQTLPSFLAINIPFRRWNAKISRGSSFKNCLDSARFRTHDQQIGKPEFCFS